VNSDRNMPAVKMLSSKSLCCRCFCLICILRKNSYIILRVCTRMYVRPSVCPSSHLIIHCQFLSSFTLRDQNLTWYQWHTGHEVGRWKLVVNFIKKYLIWMLILFVHEIYFDNCLMIFSDFWAWYIL
jgi:hypothetical protein